MHAIFIVFIYLLYSSYLGHPSLLGLHTRLEDRPTLLFSSRSNPITHELHGDCFCAHHSQALTKNGEF